MSWSAPMTAVAGATFAAAQFNQYVRDNLLECPTAKVSTAGQYAVATGANAMAARSNLGATIVTAETTTSTSYTDIASVGPAVTVTTGTSAKVMIKGGLENSGANNQSWMGFTVSGASSVAAADAQAINIAGVAAANRLRFGAVFLITGLTAGTNTF